MAYATPNDLQARYDARIIAQLSSDDNSGTASLTTIQAMLDDGATAINMAALQGSQYTVAQMQALVAGGDTMLVRVNCDLAIRALVERRGVGLGGGLERQVKASEEFLDALRKGQKVLNVQVNRVADLAAIVTNTGLEFSNLGDITQNEFFGGLHGTPTTTGPNP